MPEWLFDLDFPGHYFRRIKTVSVSLPCVVGPYTSVSGTLTLLRSEVRDKPARAQSGSDDPNKTVSHLPIQSIATSTAQNDAGLFELNFRDERYLPFEGSGAESTWRFRLPTEFMAFDYRTISDLVLHVRYTARDGGESLRDAAQRAVPTEGEFIQLLSVKQDFAREVAARQTGATTLKLTIKDDFRPYVYRTGFILKGGKVSLWKQGSTSEHEVVDSTVDVPISDDDLALDPHLIMRFTHSSNS